MTLETFECPRVVSIDEDAKLRVQHQAGTSGSEGMRGRLDNAKITGRSSRAFVRDERDRTWHTVGEFREQLDDHLRRT
jgi:hypothetical protein